MYSMKIEITMPKLAGNSISASTTTPAPLAQMTISLIHFHSKVAKDFSPHQASTAMPT